MRNEKKENLKKINLKIKKKLKTANWKNEEQKKRFFFKLKKHEKRKKEKS